MLKLTKDNIEMWLKKTEHPVLQQQPFKTVFQMNAKYIYKIQWKTSKHNKGQCWKVNKKTEHPALQQKTFQNGFFKECKIYL